MVIDSTLDRIKAENTIDIFNYVAYLRTRRTAMVQTEVCTLLMTKQDAPRAETGLVLHEFGRAHN